MVEIPLEKRLCQLRLRAGLTQNEVAEALHCSRQTYNNYERGARLPNVQVLLSLADFYDVTTDCLLGRTPIPPVSK